MYDTIIIGAGPAGLTAAIYLLRANKKVLIIEKEGVGGQIASSPLVENYPGYTSISGADLANNLFEQVMNLGADFEIDEVKEITKDKEVITESNTFESKTIIIATGCKPRRLNIEHEEKFIGNGIHFCVSCDGAFYKNKTVAVVGGGSSALINAISLSDICKKVYVIQNLEYLTGEKALQDKLKEKNNVEVLLSKTIKEYVGEDSLSKIILNNNQEIPLNGLFLSIGFIPATQCFSNIITLNEYGYIIDNESKTNIDGIFVAGDVRNKKIRQLTTATSDGTIAAINVINYLQN